MSGLEVATAGAKAHELERGINLPKPLGQTRSQVEDIPAARSCRDNALRPHHREIAWHNAMPHLEREIEHLQSMASSVYEDSFTVALTFKSLILDDKIDKAELVRAVRERPEQFGVLRGKSGLFGDNAERKQALSRAEGLSSHVGHAAEIWERRLQEARQSEEWQREKCDIVEVPGLTPKSEAILKAFDQLDSEEKSQFLEQMTKTRRVDRRSPRQRDRQCAGETLRDAQQAGVGEDGSTAGKGSASASRSHQERRAAG